MGGSGNFEIRLGTALGLKKESCYYEESGFLALCPMIDSYQWCYLELQTILTAQRVE
jgi:hypothetical protein